MFFRLIIFWWTVANILLPHQISDVKDIELIYLGKVNESEKDEIIFGEIQDAALSNDERVFLLSSTRNSVLVYTTKGEFIEELGRKGRGPGELLMPISLVSNSAGDVFVTDLGNAKISIWNSDYKLVEELSSSFSSGWYAHFRSMQSDGGEGFYWTLNANPANEFDQIKIYKISNGSYEVSPAFTINGNDEKKKYAFITGWGSWDISSDKKLYLTGKTPDYSIYKFETERIQVASFGIPAKPVIQTEEERNQKLRRAEKISSHAASLFHSTSSEKPIFKNLQIDSKDFIWAHRTTEYGKAKELDVYNSTGKHITTVSLPASTDEYQLMNIYDNKVLFRVIDNEGLQYLKIYEIKYFE